MGTLQPAMQAGGPGECDWVDGTDFKLKIVLLMIDIYKLREGVREITIRFTRCEYPHEINQVCLISSFKVTRCWMLL